MNGGREGTAPRPAARLDPDVLRAIERWPSVPAVFGWLRLDRRGRWRLVDRGRPDFDEARHALGSPITNRRIVDFIARNYAADEHGRWYWQNGPQRVYVDLEAAPLVLRTIAGEGANEAPRFVTHTGAPVTAIDAGWIAPEEQLLLRTDLGGAVVHDLDLAALPLEPRDGSLVLRLASGALTLGRTTRPEETLGFVARPRDLRGRRRVPDDRRS